MANLERAEADKHALASLLRSKIQAIIDIASPELHIDPATQKLVTEMNAKHIFNVLPTDVAQATISGITIENPLITEIKKYRNTTDEKRLKQIMEKVKANGGIPEKQWGLQQINEHGKSLSDTWQNLTEKHR